MNSFSDSLEEKLDFACKRDGTIEWDFRKHDFRGESMRRVEEGAPVLVIGEDHVKTSTDHRTAQARFMRR